MKHVVVIGAGIVGTTTALALATAGFRVSVVDSRPEAGLETSFANGGLLAANSALPWTSPGTPLQLLKWLGKEDAPLLLARARESRSRSVGAQVPAQLP